MKVLYVDLEFDYGIPARGINEIGLNGFRKGFVDLGHEVSSFYYDKYLAGDSSALQRDLLDKAEGFKPDVIFFILFKDHFAFSTLDKLKQQATTVNWFGDDQWRFNSFTSRYASHFSLCVTTDKYAIPKYKKLPGSPEVLMSQWASLEFPIDNATHYEFDVSFIGGYHPARQWFLKELRKRGVYAEAFGHGWPNGPVTSKRMSEIFNRSRINLNLSNSSSYDVRFLLSSPRNIYNRIKSEKNAPQMKARNFEIPYCGGFQLAEFIPGIEDYFSIGRDIVCYKDVDEAFALIQYYLENEKERLAIRDESVKIARSKHTYTDRIRQVMGHLNR